MHPSTEPHMIIFPAARALKFGTYVILPDKTCHTTNHKYNRCYILLALSLYVMPCLCNFFILNGYVSLFIFEVRNP